MSLMRNGVTDHQVVIVLLWNRVEIGAKLHAHRTHRDTFVNKVMFQAHDKFSNGGFFAVD